MFGVDCCSTHQGHEEGGTRKHGQTNWQGSKKVRSAMLWMCGSLLQPQQKPWPSRLVWRGHWRTPCTLVGNPPTSAKASSHSPCPLSLCPGSCGVAWSRGGGGSVNDLLDGHLRLATPSQPLQRPWPPPRRATHSSHVLSPSCE